MKHCYFTTALPRLTLAAITLTSALAAGQEKILYSFRNGNDGDQPKADVIADSAGNLYGTTFYGGSQFSVGTVFRLAPPTGPGGHWTETILHTFSDLQHGWDPWAGLVLDEAGNLYGTTWLGGTCADGALFELSPAGGTWNYTVLHNFACDGADGGEPRADLKIARSGKLYGTTSVGGNGGCAGGCGVVFEMFPDQGEWDENVLYNFPGTFEEGGGTNGGVVPDKHGNLYGTNSRGSDGNSAATIFELKHPSQAGGAWTYKEIYHFDNPNDGSIPSGNVVFDEHGNLYGATQYGGGTGCSGVGCGVVFRLERREPGRWTYQVLYRFMGDGDGELPDNLTVGEDGKLYGVASGGGTGPGCSAFGFGCPVTFRLNRPRQEDDAWTETVLHTYRGGKDGFGPVGLSFGKDGLLYGAGVFGGILGCDKLDKLGCGTVSSLVP